MSAHILGRGAFLSGFKIQDFAVYGAERRGAPLSSFCRISKEPIGTRGYIFNPDHVVSLDHSIGTEIILAGAKKGATVLINSDKKVPKMKDFKIYHIDATSIALEIIGKPIPNVAILGAFLELTKMFPLKNLERAIEIELEEAGHGEMADSNIRACRVCYRKING